jgi:hypothetical protein
VDSRKGNIVQRKWTAEAFNIERRETLASTVLFAGYIDCGSAGLQ